MERGSDLREIVIVAERHGTSGETPLSIAMAPYERGWA